MNKINFAGNLLPADLDSIKDKIRGTILGSACANSLGGSCLGLNHREILVSTGLKSLKDFAPGLSRSQLPSHQPGDLLSDTYVALTFAESLIEQKGLLLKADIQTRFKELLANKEFLSSGVTAAYLAAMRKMADNIQSSNGSEIQDLSALTKALALGCLPGDPKSSEPTQLAIQFVLEQCLPTVKDRQILAATAVITDSINRFIKGMDLSQGQSVPIYIKEELKLASTIDERFAQAWDDIAPDLDYGEGPTELPYSLVNIESDINELVPSAVGIFLLYRHNLEEAIGAAALSGGDTDTVAFIVGALSGAYHGASQIPQRWLKQISQRDRLELVADKLIEFWC